VCDYVCRNGGGSSSEPVLPLISSPSQCSVLDLNLRQDNRSGSPVSSSSYSQYSRSQYSRRTNPDDEEDHSPDVVRASSDDAGVIDALSKGSTSAINLGAH
jgi:hypothetical protein